VPTAEELWRKYDEVESRLTADFSERMLDLAELRPGMRVLDLATGRGEPALRAARRVAPSGSVLGVDVENGVLAIAREKAARENITNLELRMIDAETLDGVPSANFHVATARWGLMYMRAPVAALSSTHRALISGGVLVAAFWAEPERVPYYSLPRNLLAREEIDFEAPGVFRYAHLERIERDFAASGFSVEHFEEHDVPVFESARAADVVTWVRDFGLSRLLAGLPEATQEDWEHRLLFELEQRRSEGVIRLGGVTRIVVARAQRHP
jgi:ubiquinone/menaquinone biosynthesis C-methylase UbiE